MITYNEYLRFNNNPLSFAEEAIKFNHVRVGLTNYIMNPEQVDILCSYKDNTTTIHENLRRQCGATTALSIIGLHAATFNHNFKIGIVSSKNDLANAVLKNILEMRESLDPAFKHEVLSNNHGYVVFNNDTTIQALSSNPESIRGMSFDLMLIDNSKHVNKSAIIPAMSQVAKVVMVSTKE